MKIDVERQKEKILECHKKIAQLRNQIKPHQRANYDLERTANELDKSIEQLVHKQTTPAEIVAKLSKKKAKKKGDEEGFAAVIANNKHAYGQLFWLLQNHPRYLARLTPHVTNEYCADFVKTVIFDLFGNSYDSREERLLLTLFQLILKDRFDRAADTNSLFRANDAVSQMLSQYARRGLGLGILADILKKPLQDIVTQKELNLEINPVIVYQQIIKNYESKNNQKWNQPRNLGSEDASRVQFVQDAVRPRLQQLQFMASELYKRINDGAEALPYGVRWVCKQLAQMAKAQFPNLDRYQVGSLVGGYIHLRFFNPVIVSPETANFVEKTAVSKMTRRNLILVAKMLQSLSNGVELGKHKELYMRPLQTMFIEPHKEMILNYFDRVIDVTDLQDRAEFDDLLAHVVKRDTILQLDINQIIAIHRLVMDKKNELMGMTGASGKNMDINLARVLESLRQATGGVLPEKVKRADNHKVAVTLQAPQGFYETTDGVVRDRGRTRIDFTANTVRDGRHMTIGHGTSPGTVLGRTQDLIKELIAIGEPDVPEILYQNHSTSFRNFTQAVAHHAYEQGNQRLQALTQRVQEQMKSAPEQMPSVLAGEDPQNAFVMQMAMNADYYKKGAKTSMEKLRDAKRARDVLSGHNQYLKDKVADYEQYMQSVQAQEAALSKNFKTAKKEYSHRELTNLAVIQQVAPAHETQMSSKADGLLYKFKQTSYNTFEVTVKYKTRLKKMKVLGPLMLTRTDLTARQMVDSVNSKMWLKHEGENLVCLNINLTINLLNRDFGGPATFLAD